MYYLMRTRTPRPSISTKAGATRGHVRNCRSEPSWRDVPRRPGSRSARSRPTAPTETRTGSAASRAGPACRSSWPSDLTTAPGPAASARIPRSTPPERWSGRGQAVRATGSRWSVPSTTGTPRRGTPPMRRSGPGARTDTRLVVAAKDPASLPEKATWYLATNLPRPGSPRVHESEHPPADLAEITGIYGIRHWIEQPYKQVKDQLGWADFQVRSDTAIRRHQTLVNCAFGFCWNAGLDRQPTEDTQQPTDPQPPQPEDAERGEPKTRTSAHRLLAQSTPSRPRLAHPVSATPTLVAGLAQHTPTPAATSPDRHRHHRPGPAPLPPNLTNHR